MKLRQINFKTIICMMLAGILLTTVSAAATVKREMVTRDSRDGKEVITSEEITTDKGYYYGLVPSDNIDVPLGKESDDYENVVDGLELDQFMAHKIANVIFESRYGKKFIEETKFVVMELNGKNMFVIARFEEESLGNDQCIAIDKKTGKIISIWSTD